MAASAGATARRLLSTWSPNHQQLEWSPDGTLIAFLQGDELKFNAYITDGLAVADVRSRQGAHAHRGARSRGAQQPSSPPTARSLQFAVEDDGHQYPASVELASGVVTPLARDVVVHELAAAAGPHRRAGLERPGAARRCTRSSRASCAR